MQPVWHLRRALPNLKDEQVLVPLGIKGVGDKTSRKLLGKFKSLRNLFNASYEELEKVLKSKAAHFIEIVTRDYEVLAVDSNENGDDKK